MTAKTFVTHTFTNPIGFEIPFRSKNQSNPINYEELLSALHDLLTCAETIDAFNRPEVTDQNFQEYKTACYFQSLARYKARQLLEAAGRNVSL